MESEVTHLKEQLSSCQQKLEELKKRYEEVDEEYEIGAEYLRKRGERRLRLKQDKLALENIIADLKEKLKSSNPNYSSISNTKINVVNAAVNTDEDWRNLHSMIVDRMFFDAEVEKNKKLVKTIEVLHFNNQDLKKTMAKMQKALEKNTVKDSEELETTKAELRTCKQELDELKEKYKKLDEECEYLRERDEQCRKLKEAKALLEEKLKEYQDTSNVTQSVYKKTQTLHDKNHAPTVLKDASTETNEDLLSSQKDDNTLRTPGDENDKEIKRLKAALDNLSQQKAALEHQLLSCAFYSTVCGYRERYNSEHSSESSQNNSMESEVTHLKEQLSSCQQELEELKKRYEEVDEECEICAEYLRERDEQCLRLKKEKRALEEKLKEYQDTSNVTQSVYMKTQTLHDKNHAPTVLKDASTETNEDLLSSQKDDNTLRTPGDENDKEIKRLKAALDNLSQQKAALEHQLLTVSSTPATYSGYVATGSAIIQNQQLTDVMKENQKLKKIIAKLVTMCEKRGKSLTDSNRENEEPTIS